MPHNIKKLPNIVDIFDNNVNLKEFQEYNTTLEPLKQGDLL